MRDSQIEFSDSRIVSKLPSGISYLRFSVNGKQLSTHHKTIHGRGSSNWTICKEKDCIGRVLEQGKCFAHLEEPILNLHLANLVKNVKGLLLTGVTITKEVIDRLFSSCVVNQKNKIFLVPIHMSYSTITTRISFLNYTFNHHFSVQGSTFLLNAGIEFRNSTFKEGLNASFCHFEGASSFWNCEFIGDARFSNVTVGQKVTLGFEDCKFRKDLLLEQSNSRSITINNCDVEKKLDLSESYSGFININNSTFRSHVSLNNTQANNICLNGSTFEACYDLGEFSTGYIYIRDSHFHSRLNANIACLQIEIFNSQFINGATFTFLMANISLIRTKISALFRILGQSSNLVERSALITLEESDAGKMNISNIDMKKCEFYRCRELEDIVIDSTCSFKSFSYWWLASRKIIYDEIIWRITTKANSFMNYKRLLGQSDIDTKSKIVDSSEVASIYRCLRVSAENKGNRPGASDYYYGEMEMRRLSNESNSGEAFILQLYWMISGYGLRASRSFLWLFSILFIQAFLLINFGFENKEAFSEAILMSTHSILPGIKPNILEHPVNITGEWLLTISSIIGSFLIAMGALAIRGRVKR